jgi:hypothetical protein
MEFYSSAAQVLSCSNDLGYYFFAERGEESSSYRVSVWTIERGVLVTFNF